MKGKGKLSNLLGVGLKRRDPQSDTRDKKDSMIMTWLWNSMTPEINDTCMFMIIAKDIWDDVHYTYSKAFNRA